MRQLILTRHAKSDWGDPLLNDHDRPLNSRGERDAPRMARHLLQEGVTIERIISSTAVRARSTAEAFSTALGSEVSGKTANASEIYIEFDRELYLATAPTLLRKAVASDAHTVMLVAHDPGISELASTLSNGGIQHMPTCAVARFIWSVGSWSEAITHPTDSWSLDTPRSRT